MEKKKVPFVLLCLLTSAILVACGPSQSERNAQVTTIDTDIFAYLTAEAPTPTPQPELSEVVLTLEDLPSGFEAIPLDEVGYTNEDLSFDDFTVESSFYFFEAEHNEFVMGYTRVLPNNYDLVVFDKALHGYVKEAARNSLEANTIVEEKELPDLDDIGDASVGWTSLSIVEGLYWRLDVVLFRRDIVTAFVYNIYIDGDNPIVPVDDVAGKLDERIIGALQPSN